MGAAAAAARRSAVDARVRGNDGKVRRSLGFARERQPLQPSRREQAANGCEHLPCRRSWVRVPIIRSGKSCKCASRVVCAVNDLL
jgi:hypothetical protein